LSGGHEELPAAKAIRDNLVQSSHVVKLPPEVLAPFGAQLPDEPVAVSRETDAEPHHFAKQTAAQNTVATR
jgi:hypothetical protein